MLGCDEGKELINISSRVNLVSLFGEESEKIIQVTG